VCHRHDVVGEQNLLGNGCHRWYDLVVNQRQAELLVVEQQKIEDHPQRDLLWRNISKILSLKLKQTSSENATLQRRIEDDTQILQAYTNEYALSRRLQSGRGHSTDYKIENAIVWFSDIENFSRHILNMSPTRTADIVQRFFNAQTQPIEDRGGYIDKFMGDGLMAFWMLPTDAADIAICEAAVAAAEEAVAEVTGIAIGSEPLDLRVGLHFGLVLSGDFGSATRHQFTLIGADVNKAARLEEIHPADISSGSRELGPIRLSAEFRSNLPLSLQRKYARHSVSEAKNIGQVEFYS
jgi:class 3 adenylate cyclase